MDNPAAFLDGLCRDVTARRLNFFDLVLYDGAGWHSRELLAVSPCQNCYSVTKSFTAAAVGAAQDAGLLSVEDELGSFFSGRWPDGHDPEMKKVRIKHLLTHTMGLERGFLFEADRHLQQGDWLERCLITQLKYKPGERYTYSNSNFYLLSRIIHETSGATLERFAYEKIFKPLSIENYSWTCCPEGETQGGTGLYLSTADMAKLGALYLNGGVWNETRVLSSDWVAAATTNRLGHITDTRYGYGVVISENGYRFAGAYGQFVIVRPSHNIVVAAHGYIDDAALGPLVDRLL